MKNITQFNENNKPHGYWELYYFPNGSIAYKCFYDNGKEVGYSEHSWNTGLRKKTYHI